MAGLEQAAQEWVLAGEMAERGEFPPARSAVDDIRPRLDRAGLDRFEQDLIRREDRFRTAWHELQDAVAGRDSRHTAAGRQGVRSAPAQGSPASPQSHLAGRAV